MTLPKFKIFDTFVLYLKVSYGNWKIWRIVDLKFKVNHRRRLPVTDVRKKNMY